MTAEEYGQLMRVRPRHPDGRMRSPTAIAAELQALPPFPAEDVARGRAILLNEGPEMFDQYLDALTDESLETPVPFA